MGSIYLRYFVLADSAAVRSAVGFPIEGPAGGDPDGAQRFSAGYLATNAAGTAAIVGGTAVPAAERNALIAKWRQSIPGKQPAHDTVWTGAGAYFKTDPDLGYDKTFTIKAGSSTAYYVKGPIQDRYHASGAWDGPLGWPTSDESCLDVPCRYAYSNFERGHIRFGAGPDRAQVATVVAGAVPATPRRIVFDSDLGKETFSFTLSRSLQAASGAPDGDQDGLDDDAEKQLAFLAAPRIFWDEEESSSENQDFVFYRRLDMVQVRPRSADVSRWTPAQGRKWITIRLMMAYPEQYTDFALGSSHIGDSEMVELRLYSAAGSGFAEWRIGEFVFTPHGGDLQYYGDVGVLAARAKALGTAHIWIATDEDGHGSWGGSETDSDDCRLGGGSGIHDCFDGGSLREALAAGRYWWFDPSRDIGEPEGLRYDAWPMEPRGSSTAPFVGPAVAPQIKREPNNPHAAYIENNSGRGVAREYIRYTDSSPDISAAKRFCGWRCPVRKADGQCARYPNNGFAKGDVPDTCDGGGVAFPRGDFTTALYGNLYPVGVGYYRSGAIQPNDDYRFADFTYQLWGNANILPLTSGNVANRWQYGASAAEMTLTQDGRVQARPVLDARFSAAAVIDGDRKGAGWGGGGGWQSAAVPSAASPQSGACRLRDAPDDPPHRGVHRTGRPDRARRADTRNDVHEARHPGLSGAVLRRRRGRELRSDHGAELENPRHHDGQRQGLADVHLLSRHGQGRSHPRHRGAQPRARRIEAEGSEGSGAAGESDHDDRSGANHRDRGLGVSCSTSLRHERCRDSPHRAARHRPERFSTEAGSTASAPPRHRSA